jgi:hypothetical protein
MDVFDAFGTSSSDLLDNVVRYHYKIYSSRLRMTMNQHDIHLGVGYSFDVEALASVVEQVVNDGLATVEYFDDFDTDKVDIHLRMRMMKRTKKKVQISS